MAQKTSGAAKVNTVKLGDTEEELEDFFRVSKLTSLTIKIDLQTMDLLKSRHEQLNEKFQDRNDVEVTFDKSIEEVLLFGLKVNQSFQDYHSKKLRGGNSRRNDVKPVGKNNGKPNDAAEKDEDDDDIEKSLSALGEGK